MGYLHIPNLYKDQRILQFRRGYALEKIHGTTSHVSWNGTGLRFFTSGEKHDQFVALFDADALAAKFTELVGSTPAVVFGEAYGGKQQGMSRVYGPVLRFITFDVKVGESWLDVPRADKLARALGFDFVPYEEGPFDLEWIDSQRDAGSVIAANLRLGFHHREGVVLRPPFEVRLNNGERLIAKHKRPEFSERAHEPKVVDPAAQKVLEDARAIADEWVVPMRLEHVIARLTVDGVEPGIEKMKSIIAAMVEDVEREAAGEIVVSKEARTAIGTRTAQLFKARLAPKKVVS